MDPKVLALIAHFLQAILPRSPKTQVGGMDVMPPRPAPAPPMPVKSFEGPGSMGPPPGDELFDPRMERPPSLPFSTKTYEGAQPKQQTGGVGLAPRRPKRTQNVGAQKSALHSFLGSMG